MIDRMDGAWHGAINTHHDELRAADPKRRGFRRFMYEAKKAHGELPRLILLHREEREGKLPKLHQQCSMSPVEPIPENHLACCLGVRCKECPELKALETPALTPEQQDEAKAWTCIAHILTQGGDPMNEGYLLTVGDRMFWNRVHEILAAGLEEGR